MPHSQVSSPAVTRILTHAAVLLTAVGLASPVAAQPRQLTMADVISGALQSSYQLVAVGKRVDAAQSSLERSSAWLASNPTVTGGASASDSKFTTTLPNNQQGPSDRFGPSYTFTAEQSFEVAGQRRLRMDVAERGLESSRHDRDNTEANIRAKAKKAFMAALASDAKAKLAHRSTALIQQVNSAFDPSPNNDRERIAFNSSTMQLYRQQRRAAGADRDREEAYREVKRLAGMAPELDITLVGELESRPRALPSLDELRAGLADRRADVAAYRSLVARSDAELALAKRSAIPDVSVFGFVTRFDSGDDTETSGGGSLGVTLPIFQGNGASIPDAISERQRAMAELEDLERLVDANLVTAYANAREAEANLATTLSEILPRARENVELQQNRARKGEVRSYDIVDYDLELVTAEEELITAQRAYTDALIELEKAAAVQLVGPEVSAAAPQAAGAGDDHDPEK